MKGCNFCYEKERLPQIQEENKKLKTQFEEMKNCLNCKYGGMHSEGLYCYALRELMYDKQMNEKENCCDKWELAE